jgi:hypothetical protein
MTLIEALGLILVTFVVLAAVGKIQSKHNKGYQKNIWH